MKQKIRIGCDPGADGGICAIGESGIIKFYKTPVVDKQIDINRFKNIILELAGELDDTGNWKNDVLVIIEDVHSIFGSSAKSNFSFGRNLGILEGIVLSFDLPTVKVAPKTWQSLLFQGIPQMFKLGKTKINKAGKETISTPTDTKKMALLSAKRLFPNTSFLASERSKIDHDGIVDSVLLAKYGMLRY